MSRILIWKKYTLNIRNAEAFKVFARSCGGDDLICGAVKLTPERFTIEAYRRVKHDFVKETAERYFGRHVKPRGTNVRDPPLTTVDRSLVRSSGRKEKSSALFPRLYIG